MNVLCVGGIAHGRRVVLPDEKKHYEVSRLTPISLREDTVPEIVVQRIDRYNLFPIHPVTRAVVFALESLTPTQVMEMLMDGYREEKK